MKLTNETQKGFWTESEMALLNSLYKKFGSAWAHIAKQIPGRTAQQVKDKIWYQKSHARKQYAFSNEDDKMLIKLNLAFNGNLSKIRDAKFQNMPKAIIEKRIGTICGRPMHGFASSRDLEINREGEGYATNKTRKIVAINKAMSPEESDMIEVSTEDLHSDMNEDKQLLEPILEKGMERSLSAASSFGEGSEDGWERVIGNQRSTEDEQSGGFPLMTQSGSGVLEGLPEKSIPDTQRIFLTHTASASSNVYY